LLRLLSRIIRLTPAMVVGLFIVLWLGTAVALASLGFQRNWLLAYIGATLVYAFFVGTWAMLRTVARLRGFQEEGESPDGSLLLETLPAAAMITGKNGGVRAINNAWLDLFALTRHQTLKKKYDRFCEPVLRGHLDRVLKSRKPSYGLSLTVHRPDGGNVPFTADIMPFQNGLLITAHVQHENQTKGIPFLKQNRHLQLGRVAVYFLDALAERLEQTAETNDPTALNDALATMRRLADYAGDDAPENEKIDVNTLVAKAADLARPLARACEVKLSAGADDPLPPLAGNQRDLEIALLALVLNALESAPANSAVRLTATEAPDGVELAVSDAAPTLNEEEQTRLYSPWDDEAGLGLAVGRQIARAHGGDLLYSPREPVGNRFILRLPSATS